MTYPTIRGTTICRIAAALGIALAAMTLTTTAQADRGDRSKGSAVHGSRDSQAYRQGNRTHRSVRRIIRRHGDRRAQNRRYRARNQGQYRHAGRPRRPAGFALGHIFRPAPIYRGRPGIRRPASYGGHRGQGCRVLKRVGHDRYGRKVVSKRRVCNGPYGKRTVSKRTRISQNDNRRNNDTRRNVDYDDSGD